MRHWMPIRALFCLVALFSCSIALADGHLDVRDAWVREAPPGAQVMAGFATLANTGDAPLTVLSVESGDFAMAALHESTLVDGMAKMQALERLALAPGESARLQPGGKHLMLMRPRHAIAVGDALTVRFLLEGGMAVDAAFTVRAAAPAAGHDHAAGHAHE